MITLQNSVITFVVVDGQELGLTNSGTWSFSSIESVAGWTNAPVTVPSDLPDGSTIIVDGAGVVSFQPGPDVQQAVNMGLVSGISVVGFILALRWVYAGFMRSASIPTHGE